jgi:hypothetical protein
MTETNHYISELKENCKETLRRTVDCFISLALIAYSSTRKLTCVSMHPHIVCLCVASFRKGALQKVAGRLSISFLQSNWIIVIVVTIIIYYTMVVHHKPHFAHRVTAR